MPANVAIAKGRRKARLRQTALVLTVSAALAVGAAACANAPSNPSASDGGTSGGSEHRSTSTSFSLAFARCMRAHGVPKFPDPGGQLGPNGGADPASPEFQAAVNGPCRPLAPPAWVSSGEVSGS